MWVILFSTLVSISFCQSFIASQRPIFNFLKWEEINNNQILFQKVGPPVNTKFDPLELTSFYYSGSDSTEILESEIFPEISLNNSSGSRIRFYGSVAINLSERLIIQNEFEFDNKGKNDPHFQGIERGLDNGWVGYLQHSSLTYNYSQGHLSIGRGNPYFFNMNGSLLLNPNFPPTEFLWWKHEVQWFQFDWGALMLNKEESLNRFITFHRYGINANNWRVGFTEAIMGTYENWGASEIGYLMPAAVLLETEENRGFNANLMWLLDGLVKWNNWTFYSEFLIDDFAIDGKSPPQIAGSLGLGRKYNQFLLNMEYAHINRWTGNYCAPLQRWIERDVPIGHSMGSDAHNLLINSYFPFSKNLAVELSFNWMVYGGATAIDRLKDWPDGVPCDANIGENDPPPSKKNTTYYTGGTLHYLFKENIMAKLNMDFRKNEVLWNLSISYGL